MRRRMLAYAHSQMGERLRVGHDPESVVNSAEASANASKNAHLWDLPPEELLRCLLAKTKWHVRDRVGYETAQKRDMRRNAGPLEHHGEVAADEPDPAVVAEWKDLWDWVQQRLRETNPVYVQILDLYLQGHSCADIAFEIGGLSKRTVERTVKRVVALLREQLDPDYEGPE
jgi:DNA-directed RNA polymerase specialized sigma24 family protein